MSKRDIAWYENDLLKDMYIKASSNAFRGYHSPIVSPKTTFVGTNSLNDFINHISAYLADDDRNIDGMKSFLGLGTSNPADRIDLADSDGNIRIYDGNSTAHVFGDEASGESDGIILRTLVNPASGEPIFAVESSGLSQRLRVEHGGALKTSNYLEVDGAGSSYIRGDLSVGATTPPQNTLDVFGEAVVGSGYAGANAAPADGLLVEGNVGIGTSAPGAKLDVNGDVKINSRIDFDGDGYIHDNGTQLILGH